ncbi:caffeoylshikimate esterase [Solanum lycopersicum]|uniref:caffeoylshikimate esterase n=1 Tax=Solanum lycopersicum TaxID=4081 RepID=UPI000532AF6D|nr:uncharacterized protein LOC104645732 [Solanum lycopersicum]
MSLEIERKTREIRCRYGQCGRQACAVEIFSFQFKGIAWKLASFGCGVVAMESFWAFRRSSWLHTGFDKLVEDVIEHYLKVEEKPEFCNLPSFLFEESMGGAIALKVHQKQPDAWNGTVLLAPLCKIADSIVPPWLVTQILIGVAKFLPTKKLHIVRTQDLGETAVREAKKKEHAAYNV